MNSVEALASNGLSAAVNKLLKTDPDGAAALRELAGKSILIEVTGTPLALQADIDTRGVVTFTRRTDDADVDVTLTGAPLAMARLVIGRDRHDVFGKNVRIRGDVGVIAQLKATLARIDFDLEELLSQSMGDAPAHALVRAARGVGVAGSRTIDNLTRDVAEFLVEESRMVPGHIELEEFVVAVDDLRDDVERLEQRIANLRQQP